jgi:hypothetical protein
MTAGDGGINQLDLRLIACSSLIRFDAHSLIARSVKSDE